MIGGNVNAVIQQNTGDTFNAIGERVPVWTDIQHLHGWLDMMDERSNRTYDAKLQESTHIFLCDYVAIDRNISNKRMVINGNIYDVLMIDNPMELNQHLEIYLKYIGG